MLTFKLTCVTCTSNVTSLGWGVGMLTFMLSCVTMDELHDQRSDGGHRSSLEESYGNVSGKKIIARVFRHKFPVNYRSCSKNHFKIPGILKTILGNESAVSLWRKRHFFQNAQSAGAVFPPPGSLRHFRTFIFLSEINSFKRWKRMSLRHQPGCWSLARVAGPFGSCKLSKCLIKF